MTVDLEKAVARRNEEALNLWNMEIKLAAHDSEDEGRPETRDSRVRLGRVDPTQLGSSINEAT